MASLYLTETDVYLPTLWEDHIHFLAMLRRDHGEETSFDNFIDALRMESDALVNVAILSTELSEEITPYLPYFVSPNSIRDRFMEFGETLYHEFIANGMYVRGRLPYRFSQWFDDAMVLTYDPEPISASHYNQTLRG